MKPKIFLDAAKIVCESKENWTDYCCNAIDDGPIEPTGELEFFKSMFEQPNVMIQDANYGDINHGWWGKPTNKRNQMARTLALLLCYEMTK